MAISVTITEDDQGVITVQSGEGEPEMFDDIDEALAEAKSAFGGMNPEAEEEAAFTKAAPGNLAPQMMKAGKGVM